MGDIFFSGLHGDFFSELFRVVAWTYGDLYGNDGGLMGLNADLYGDLAVIYMVNGDVGSEFSSCFMDLVVISW